MNNALLAFLLSLFAGLSTVVGSIIVIFAKKTSFRLLSFSLGFSGGVMVYISIADLLPESVHSFTSFMNEKQGGIMAVVLVAVGILGAVLIDMLVPDYESTHSMPKREIGGEIQQSKMLRIGIISTIAIMLHNFPEGVVTFMAGYHNIALGISVAVAIAFHNIPEGIAVSIPIYYGTGNRKKAFLYSVLSGLTEPLGAILAYFVLAPFLNDFMMGIIFALISGIMLYISFDELLPASHKYGHHGTAVLGVLAGVCFMAIGLILI